MRCEHLWAVYEAVSAKYELCAPVSRALAKRDCFGNLGQWSRKKKLNGNSRKTCIVALD